MLKRLNRVIAIVPHRLAHRNKGDCLVVRLVCLVNRVVDIHHRTQRVPDRLIRIPDELHSLALARAEIRNADQSETDASHRQLKIKCIRDLIITMILHNDLNCVILLCKDRVGHFDLGDYQIRLRLCLRWCWCWCTAAFQREHRNEWMNRGFSAPLE